MAMAAALFLLLLAAPAAYAAEHVVGGSGGWSTSVNYATWAAGETFTVGDTLLFNYGGTHSVDQVTQNDYTNCNTGNALQSYSGGKTTISLTTAGPMYFICPTSGHCQQGMKLSITVVAATTTPGGPTPSPPSGSSSPPSTPTTTTSPPPPHSGVAGNFGNMNCLVLGVSLVLAVVLALMG